MMIFLCFLNSDAELSVFLCSCCNSSKLQTPYRSLARFLMILALSACPGVTPTVKHDIKCKRTLSFTWS